MACTLTSKAQVRQIIHSYYRKNYPGKTINDGTKLSALGASGTRAGKDHTNIAARVRTRGCSIAGFTPTAYAGSSTVGTVVSKAWTAVQANR
ncbi:MAG: hypothetical protein GY937_06065 [bacterium]|nr:hypothetical protein [bacterium]